MYYMMSDRIFAVEEFDHSTYKQIAALYVDIQTEMEHARHFAKDRNVYDTLAQNATTLRSAMLNAMERDAQQSLKDHYLLDDVYVRRLDSVELTKVYTFDDLLAVREQLERVLKRRDMQPSTYNDEQRAVIHHNIERADEALRVLHQTANPL